jgi:hypothetical protein
MQLIIVHTTSHSILESTATECKDRPEIDEHAGRQFSQEKNESKNAFFYIRFSATSVLEYCIPHAFSAKS